MNVTDDGNGAGSEEAPGAEVEQDELLDDGDDADVNEFVRSENCPEEIREAYEENETFMTQARRFRGEVEKAREFHKTGPKKRGGDSSERISEPEAKATVRLLRAKRTLEG